MTVGQSVGLMASEEGVHTFINGVHVEKINPLPFMNGEWIGVVNVAGNSRKIKVEMINKTGIPILYTASLHAFMYYLSIQY